MSQILWYKDAVIYQLHIRAFQDSNGDGIGDFAGLLQRLDHFTDLGVTALWLLPFYPSPLRDDGYDIADYYSVNPSYGTVEDFRAFLDAAHARGLRVITELVLNHTSDQNPWFQRARLAPPGSPERDFYVWSDTPERYQDTRIIFKDFELSNWTWDPIAKAYFWHRFYSHQPDLNFDNPAVHEALFEVIDFWLGMGVDGVRLDAVPYLYEREGTNCENLPETHTFLKKLRAHIDSKFEDRMLLAEANQWPEDAAAYFGDGDECHMNFHFPLMPRMFMTLQMEDRYPLVEIMQQTPAIAPNCQWGIFLRNHDELTLEMVTDEERDYMYRVYAQDPRARINLGIRRRLAPLLGNNRKKIELINSLLFSMPGTPIIYYGDEIGMGDNFYLGDRNGVRTPMQWTPGTNAGFSTANPQGLFLPLILDPEYQYTTINVEVQQKNLSSLFNWMKRILQVRKQSAAFAVGTLEFLHPENAKIVAYLRKHEEEIILVVANLSRFTQYVELDLAAYAGLTPVEMFGKTRLPELKQTHMPLTLGPHGFMWLQLQKATDGTALPEWRVPLLTAQPVWSKSLHEGLERHVLPAYLQQCRWFGGKGRRIREIKVVQDVPFDGTQVHIAVIEVAFVDGLAEQYSLPLVLLHGDKANRLLRTSPEKVLAKFDSGHVLFDALHLRDFQTALFKAMTDRGPKQAHMSLTRNPQEPLDPEALKRAVLNIRVHGGEQSNTSINYADTWLLKFYRKFETGVHPEVEMTQYLTRHQYKLPPFVSALNLKAPGGDGVMAVLAQYAQHQGDGWVYTLDALARYFERVLAARDRAENVPLQELIGGVYPERAEQLGRLTAEMHLALEREPKDPAFKPEPFTIFYGRSLYQSMRGHASKMFRDLKKRLESLPETAKPLAQSILNKEDEVMEAFGKLLTLKVEANLIRFHGDFHLGQVLNTGRDFVAIDFEGEPRLAMSERRLKRSALRDVAGMLRSFDYAGAAALMQMAPEDQEYLRPYAEQWVAAISQIYLDTYFATAAGASFVPKDAQTTQTLLDLLILDKAIYEIGYELGYRPHMVTIPLAAVEKLVAG
jgi:maltose alpha-D-glucosyltransferase / alpha-amylase